MTRSALILLIFVLVVALAMVIPSITRTIRKSRVSECAGHLHALWHSRAQFASSNDDRYIPFGGQYFMVLQQAPKLKPQGYEQFYCPLTDEERIPGRTSYRGPALLLKKLSQEDPCAADREGNHGPGEGGNVLTLFGDVKEVGANDPLWIRARTTTKE